MNSEKLDSFVLALIRETAKNRLAWFPVADLRRSLSNNCGYFRPLALFEIEFREIHENRSYYCNTNAGMVYLIYETVFSGKDSSQWDTMTLFLHPQPYSEPSIELLTRSDQLYRLENAVLTSLARGRSTALDEEFYLDLFLKGSDPVQ